MSGFFIWCVKILGGQPDAKGRFRPSPLGRALPATDVGGNVVSRTSQRKQCPVKFGPHAAMTGFVDHRQRCDAIAKAAQELTRHIRLHRMKADIFRDFCRGDWI
jgi:hypothetical protein